MDKVSCEWNSLDINMTDSWNDNNGMRIDVTEYLAGYSGKEFFVSLDAGYYAKGNINVSFDVYGSDGILKNTVSAATKESTDDGTKVKVSGSATVAFEDGDSVYLSVKQPSGFHSYDNIEISVNSELKLNNNADFWDAYSNGGNYVLGNSSVTVANAGTHDENNLKNGTINGNNGRIIKGEGKNGDAMLFHNTAVKWVYSNMTIDGNKSNITHTDACLWFMGGADVTFKNVKIQNFCTTAADKLAINNVGGKLTLDNVEFSGNENQGENADKYGKYTDIFFSPWGEATIALKGATKAKMYYVSGSLDVSSLSTGCNVGIKADSAEAYEYLKSLNCDSEKVATSFDDENMTVSFS